MKSASQANSETVKSRMLYTRDNKLLIDRIEKEIDKSISFGKFNTKFEINVRHGSYQLFDISMIENFLKKEGYDVIEASSETNKDFSMKIKIELSWEDA